MRLLVEMASGEKSFSTLDFMCTHNSTNEEAASV